MRNFFSLIQVVVFLVAFAIVGHAQNGKLISQKSFKADKNLIAEMDRDNPESNFADTFKLAEMSQITYESEDDKIKGYLIRPTKPGKYPCLIYNRDGWDDTGALTDLFVAEKLHKIARWGYVVVASQYRGAAGGEGEDEFGGKDVDDVLNLVDLLARIPEADTSRIGMYGWNRGGMMTYIALKKTKKIDAAIVSSGVANIFLYAAEAVEMYPVLERLVPNYPDDRVNPLKERSLVFWPDEMDNNTPILLLHGSCDKYIHPTHSIDAFEKLFKELHPVRLVILEGGDNELSQLQPEADDIMQKWLNKYVRDEKDFPPIIDLTR